MPAPPFIRRAPLAILAALSLAACGGDAGPSGVIPRERFVAANVAVRSLPDGATPEQRAAALKKHGVTERQLRAWVNGHSRDPETMAKAWEEIAFKLDSAGGMAPPPVHQAQPAPAGTAPIIPPPVRTGPTPGAQPVPGGPPPPPSGRPRRPPSLENRQPPSARVRKAPAQVQ